MSDSNGCKIVATALIVAIIVGTMGFASGFLTHTLIVRAASEVATGPTIEAVPVQDVEDASPEGDAPSVDPTGPPPAETVDTPDPTGAQFDLFWEAWNLIQEDFYGDLPTEEELTYGAIRGALNTLDDPFTGFVEPRMAEIGREDDSGAFEGIGAYVTMTDGHLEIISTFRDQPAEQAGVQRGDIVLEVDDTPIENMSIYEAISLIRGPAGTTVRLKIMRSGESPFEIEVIRARIDIPVVESEMLDGDIAYARLLDFSSDASAKLTGAMQELFEQDPAGLILDLRSNPGGWLHESIKTAGLFLPQGELILYERFKDGTERTFKTDEPPVAPDIPMVVLVDGGSASASEIVAGALQDYGRAVLIGETTFGKGSVQLPHELSNGAELRVTIARWFTPNNRAIHGQGLEPDIRVEITEEDMDNDNDPQLQRAIEYLRNGQ